MSSPPKSPSRASRFIEADLSENRDQQPSDLLSHILSEQDQNEFRRRSASQSSSGSASPASSSSSAAVAGWQHRRSGSNSSVHSQSGLTYCSPGYNAAAPHDYQMLSNQDVYQTEGKPQSTGEKIKGRLRALTLGKGENKARVNPVDEHRHGHSPLHG